jgi:hypothetical protein
MTGSLLLRIALLAACGFAASGCAAAPRADEHRTTPEASSSNTDPCAMRLHDICAPLLLYYAKHHALPARMEMLSQVPGFEHVNDFTCPASGKPYTYNPAGVPAPDRAMRLIIYDATATPSGLRWAISIPVSPGEGPLVAKVVAVAEPAVSGKSR